MAFALVSHGAILGEGPSIKDVHKIWHFSPSFMSSYVHFCKPLPPPYGRSLHVVRLQHNVPVMRYHYLSLVIIPVGYTLKLTYFFLTQTVCPLMHSK